VLTQERRVSPLSDVVATDDDVRRRSGSHSGQRRAIDRRSISSRDISRSTIMFVV
jgi:hypothetical protein